MTEPKQLRRHMQDLRALVATKDARVSTLQEQLSDLSASREVLAFALMRLLKETAVTHPGLVPATAPRRHPNNAALATPTIMPAAPKNTPVAFDLTRATTATAAPASKHATTTTTAARDLVSVEDNVLGLSSPSSQHGLVNRPITAAPLLSTHHSVIHTQQAVAAFGSHGRRANDGYGNAVNPTANAAAHTASTSVCSGREEASAGKAGGLKRSRSAGSGAGALELVTHAGMHSGMHGATGSVPQWAAQLGAHGTADLIQGSLDAAQHILRESGVSRRESLAWRRGASRCVTYMVTCS